MPPPSSVARIRQYAFVIALLGFCWYGMMATHELGHVLGAWWTGGVVKEVVLHPFRISQTNVFPNPAPGYVVWSGPLFGCFFPLLVAWTTPKRLTTLFALTRFFAGFCLIANGAYIGIGAAEEIGDCREMIKTGTPILSMQIYGAVAAGWGLFIWHRLGSLQDFFRHPEMLPARTAVSTSVGFALSFAAWWLALQFWP